jgi:hypothetical protein
VEASLGDDLEERLSEAVDLVEVVILLVVDVGVCEPTSRRAVPLGDENTLIEGVPLTHTVNSDDVAVLQRSGFCHSGIKTNYGWCSWICRVDMLRINLPVIADRFYELLDGSCSNYVASCCQNQSLIGLKSFIKFVL